MSQIKLEESTRIEVIIGHGAFDIVYEHTALRVKSSTIFEPLRFVGRPGDTMFKSHFAYMLAVGLVLAGLAHTARAEGAIEAWANWALAPKVWKGQMVREPDPVARPKHRVRVDSWRLPVHVHAPLGTPPAQLAAALSALEVAFDMLSERGWPLPYSDGGQGGSVGFDLYLEPGSRSPAHAEVDAAIAWSDFDAAQTYAVVDAGLPLTDLPACVLSALLQAALLGQDPSEAPSVLRASADFGAWSMLGELGCAGSFVSAQRAPERALMGRDPESAGAGALLLAVLSERHDGGTGAFIQALWELTRQRSRGLVPAGVLRSSPDLWEVLVAALKMAREELPDLLEDFAVARLFAGEPASRKAAPYRVLAALPDGAGVPITARLALADLPEHVRLGDEGLAPLGSAYVRIAIADPGATTELRVWLRGEIGPLWSVVAVRLAADGGELGRVKAPPRRMPQSYLPVLLTPDTAEVVVVVTHLLAETPDADRPPPLPHGFELILDRGPQ